MSSLGGVDCKTREKLKDIYILCRTKFQASAAIFAGLGLQHSLLEFTLAQDRGNQRSSAKRRHLPYWGCKRLRGAALRFRSYSTLADTLVLLYTYVNHPGYGNFLSISPSSSLVKALRVFVLTSPAEPNLRRNVIATSSLGASPMTT